MALPWTKSRKTPIDQHAVQPIPRHALVLDVVLCPLYFRVINQDAPHTPFIPISSWIVGYICLSINYYLFFCCLCCLIILYYSLQSSYLKRHPIFVVPPPLRLTCCDCILPLFTPSTPFLSDRLPSLIMIELQIREGGCSGRDSGRALQ